MHDGVAYVAWQAGREMRKSPVIALTTATRRELLLALICGVSGRTWAEGSLSPKTFPWAVDRQAHLARRRIFSVDTEPSGYRGVLLQRLHLALDAWWRAPDSPTALIRVRERLLAVKSATQETGTPVQWREVHDFADILLNSAEWRRCA